MGGDNSMNCLDYITEILQETISGLPRHKMNINICDVYGMNIYDLVIHKVIPVLYLDYTQHTHTHI